MKKALSAVVVLVAVGVTAWCLWPEPPPEPPVEFAGYTPSEEFSDAYEALCGKPAQTSVVTGATVSAVTVAKPEPVAVDDPGKRNAAYNIEKTMQVFRSVERAQQTSKDWMGYLKFLAERDYSGVPDEVLKAQAMVLPVLERLHTVEKELGDTSNTMTVLNAMGAGALTVVENLDVATMASMALGPAAFLTGSARGSVDKGLNQALDVYKRGKSERERLRRKLHEVQMAYIKYLATYVPIRRKYEKEWDALCLMKDKAYLQVGRGQYAEALETTAEIMERYPCDRESILLRSLSLTRLAMFDGKAVGLVEKGNRDIALSSAERVIVRPDHPLVVEAGGLLNGYLKNNPEVSGPALVLKGLLECATGDVVRAGVSFDQSSVEYPRQAAQLNDLLEVYASRPYLEKTAEGQRLLRFHRSLCEGFGVFSPNLEKAFAYESVQDYAKAKEEIYNHFFRRGNQEVFHELFSDMEFCEEFLTVGFKGLLMEHAFLDLDVSNAGWTESSREVKVSLANRTDFELKNVRLFLCVQFTEMYMGEYDVVKVGTIGRLAAHADYKFPKFTIPREGKVYKDISRVRAIVMSDDRICWVDPMAEKRKHAGEVSTGMVKIDLPYTPDGYLSAFGTDRESLGKMAREMPVARMKRMMVLDEIVLSLPRVFSVLDPVFTIGEICSSDCVYPSKAEVEGQKISVHFPYSLKPGESADFCIYSDYVSFKAKLTRTDETISVSSIEPLEPLQRRGK